MALEFVPDVRTGTGGLDLVTIDRHLYLTEDGTRVVEEADVDGRWLWAAPGQQKPRAEAQRLGAIKPVITDDAGPELLAAASDEGAEGSGAKQRKTAAANKMRGKTADKGA